MADFVPNRYSNEAIFDIPKYIFRKFSNYMNIVHFFLPNFQLEVTTKIFHKLDILILGIKFKIIPLQNWEQSSVLGNLTVAALLLEPPLIRIFLRIEPCPKLKFKT